MPYNPDPDPGHSGETPESQQEPEGVNTAVATAVSLHLEGKREQALAVLGEALAQGLETPALYAAMGRIEFELERYEKAAASYRRLLELDPETRAGSLQLAVCYHQQELWEEASVAYREALLANGGPPEARIGLGTCLLHLDAPGEALESFDEALEAAPEDRQAQFGRAVALQRLSRFDDARAAYEQILEQDPGSEGALRNIVALSVETGDDGLMERYADQMLARDANSRAALSALASRAFRQEDYRRAAELCQRLAETAPENYEAWFNLGVAQQKQARWDEAVGAYAKAVELRPDAALAHQNRGVVLMEAGARDAAAEEFRQAIQLDPNLTDSACHLAWLLEQSGAGEEAGNIYEDVVGRDGRDNGFAGYRLGVLKLEQGDYEQSIRLLRLAVKGGTGNSEARWYLGRALWLSGDHAGAAAAFEQVLEHDPESVGALRSLASLALEAGDDRRAMELHDRLFALGERTPEICYNAGLLYQKADRREKAIELYEEAVSRKPDFAEALLNLGHVLSMTGHRAEAVNCWQRALELKPELASGYFGG